MVKINNFHGTQKGLISFSEAVCMYVCVYVVPNIYMWLYVSRYVDKERQTLLCTSMYIVELNLNVYPMYVCIYVCMYVCMYA